jgi:hypothetical protein
MEELKPGRELDDLVARKVFGFIPRFDGGYRDGAHGLHPERPYSTDIEAAWELFSLPHFDAWALGRKASDGKWWVFNPYVHLEGVVTIAIGDTAPHAICLAALRAVGA